MEALPDLKRSFNAVARTAETNVHQDGIGLLPLGEANGIFGGAATPTTSNPAVVSSRRQLERDQHVSTRRAH